jgi:hypothetical protein
MRNIARSEQAVAGLNPEVLGTDLKQILAWNYVPELILLVLQMERRQEIHRGFESTSGNTANMP